MAFEDGQGRVLAEGGAVGLDAGGYFVAARTGLVVAVLRFGQGDAQAVMAQVARVGVRSPGEVQIAAVFVV